LIVGILVATVTGLLCRAGFFVPADVRMAEVFGFVRPSGNARWWEYAIMVLAAFAVAWTTIDVPRLLLKWIVSMVALAEVLVAAWALNLYGLSFSPFATATAIVLSTLLGFAYAHSGGGRRKRVLRAVFGDRVSRKAFYEMVNSNVPLNFTGQLREATALVCEAGVVLEDDEEIGLAKTVEVSGYVSALNRFLSFASDYMVERGGYLDEAGGESLRVVFGEPVPDEKHALTACEAALGLLSAWDVETAGEAGDQPRLQIRIGINTGEVVTGLFGSERLASFRVSGEPVDWARRLCSENQTYSTRIIVGSETLTGTAGGVEVRPVELLENPAQGVREEVYELLAMAGDWSEELRHRRDAYWEGVVYFRELQMEEAIERLERAMPPEGKDPLCALYLDRAKGQTPAWRHLG